MKVEIKVRVECEKSPEFLRRVFVRFLQSQIEEVEEIKLIDISACHIETE